MRNTTLTDKLRRVALFAELPDEQLAWILERGTEVRLAAGEKIASQGDPPDGLYAVLEGVTEWTRNVGGQEVFVVDLGEGTIFAELILVLDAPYPTTGHAVTDVRLFKLEPENFWEMLRLCPQVLRGILATSVERAELHESVSQQHARLISLGTMAAGLAHELNNPAAAVGRGAREARGVFQDASSRAVRLGELDMNPTQRAYVAGLPEEVVRRAEEASALGSLEQSDLEDEISIWLEDHGVEEAWELSPTFAGAGLDVEWLEDLSGHLPDDTIGDVLAWLASEATGDELLRGVQQASARVSELVGAVKSYSHMDQAPQKETDVREGLENTLVMLGHKLKKGNVDVVRDYEEGLPRVCAHGGGLNQVWINLIDNAIDAVDGEGRITLRTAVENGRVLVEVADDGPGIPDGIRGRIFEPFFTTKDVGEGTGIGLDISHRVVVEEHGGDIRVHSEPGATRFQVRLPIGPAGETADSGDGS